MIKSMTGFGQAEYTDGDRKFLVEMRSVNHRFCEISVRMPRQLNILEEAVRKKIQENVKRGRIDVYIAIEHEGETPQSLEVNWSLADEYVQINKEMNQRYQWKSVLDSRDLITLPEVVQIKEEADNAESLRQPLIMAVSLACRRLLEMRETEGEQLKADLISRVNHLNNLLHEIKQQAPAVVENYRERVLRRLNEFLGNQLDIDEGRLLTEVALFADRSDIDEEITRLESHCMQFLKNLEGHEPVGRKLDFILQEMNREANTIGSKANDLLIGQKVVELKAELEKMKEQVQNIE